jgi:hypothetical protein
MIWLVEGVGFEPTVAFTTAVFKTATFVHSVTPPYKLQLVGQTSNLLAIQQ